RRGAAPPPRRPGGRAPRGGVRGGEGPPPRPARAPAGRRGRLPRRGAPRRRGGGDLRERRRTAPDPRPRREERLTMAEPLLDARGLVKSFGRVRALRGASFTVYPSEVVALVGDHGAGKSTLVKALAG